MKYLALVPGLVVFGALASVPAFGQTRGPRGFGPGGRGMDLTPEQRDQMYDRMAERQLERLTSDYDLTDAQRDAVQAKLEDIKVEQRKYSEPLTGEFRKLQQEMRDLYRNRPEDGQVDRERMNQIRDRMRQMWQGSPLMNPEHVASEIEPLLPADQVKKGREQIAERQAQWQQRRESWRQQRQSGQDGSPDDQTQWQQRRQMWQQQRQLRQQGGPNGQGDQGQRRGRQGRGGFGRFGRGDPWDQYVADFERRYQLDAAQQATATSILGELKQQRDTYRELHANDYAALRQMQDRQARSDARARLEKPVDSLFESLKKRLDRIPTSSQRKAAGPATPTSQPAE